MEIHQMLLSCLLASGVVESSQWWSGRDDVMATYLLANRHQCERLCWYRRLCQSFSFNISTTTKATDHNCVLHAANITATSSTSPPPGWVENQVCWDDQIQDNGCRNRPCKDTEICLPSFASPFFICIPSAAECLAPSQNGGVYRDLKLTQGQTTVFTCNSSLVWTPRVADTTVTCLVTGKYSGLNGTCKNATYYAPRAPFNAPLPDVAAPGWQACIKGNFTSTGTVLTRFNVNLHNGRNFSCDERRTDGGDIYLALDFRHAFDSVINKTLVYTAVSGCQWRAKRDLGPLFLKPHSYFEMTLTILANNTMQILVKEAPPLHLDLQSTGIDLTNATALEIMRDVKLFYVDLGKAC